MDTNDLNRRIRYALSLDDDSVEHLFNLAGFQASREQLIGWRQKPGDDGFQACPPDAIDALLNGLIKDRRGEPDRDRKAPVGQSDAMMPSQSRTAAAQDRAEIRFVDNNRVLKQLRIALTLKADDVQTLISKGGGNLGKSEVNALFRNASARNYRQCGDQVLRWFLSGLASTLRP